MAASKRPNPAELRYGVISRTDLATYRRILTETTADLAEVGDLMESSGIETMKIDGVTKFPRGQQLITEFVGKLEVAVARARSEVRAARQRDEMDGD